MKTYWYSFGILQEETEIHSFTMALAGKAVLGCRRAVDFHINMGQNSPKKKLLTTKSPRLKERLSREYSQKDKEVKRSTSTDKHTYIENLVEEAARRKDMKSLNQITKKLKRDTGPNQNLPLKDADGKIITVDKEKRDERSISNRFSIVQIHPDLQISRRQQMTLKSTSTKSQKQKSEKPLKPRKMEKHQEATASVQKC